MTDTGPHEHAAAEGRRPSGLLLAVGALVVVLAIGAGVYLLVQDDGTSTESAPTSTTAGSTSTTSPTTTTATSDVTTTVPVDTSAAVWPPTSSSTRYADPVAAARGFAIDDVGFTSPIVGAYSAGAPRSGEVPVQSRAQGPVTTVLVRQLGDSWWVLGSSTPNIQLASPGPLASISSPVRLQGTSTAFEATVNVRVRDDTGGQPIGAGIVMGGANGTMGPCDAELSFGRPSTASGAVMLLTRSPEDDSVTEVTTVRVQFA